MVQSETNISVSRNFIASHDIFFISSHNQEWHICFAAYFLPNVVDKLIAWPKKIQENLSFKFQACPVTLIENQK